MTLSGYSNAIVDVMLGWLKGLANWVLRLFNLAGSVTTSPLLWLSQNWLKLLIIFLVLGIVLDRVVWLIRWRPYWVWFRKERVIVNDDRFFASADMDKATSREKNLDENWDEHDYVVASTVVKRRSEAAAKKRDSGRRSRKQPADIPPRRRRPDGTKVVRHVDRRDGDAVRRDGRENSSQNEDQWQRPETRQGASDNIFSVKLNKPDVSDFYEDEVFNVANLPASSEYGEEQAAQKK